MPAETETPAEPVTPEVPETPVQDEAPVPSQTPEAPEAPAKADASVSTLPQTGTTGWMAMALLSFGCVLLACGWFLTRKQRREKKGPAKATPLHENCSIPCPARAAGYGSFVFERRTELPVRGVSHKKLCKAAVRFGAAVT